MYPSEGAGSTVRGLALGGFMGAGKTTVGRALAARLGWSFVDTDQVLTERFGPIPEQFARDGEPSFRARETALLVELAERAPCVVATGGGAWVNAENRANLRRAFRLVVLDVPLELALARVAAQGGRPLAASAAALYASRAAAYADHDLRLEVAGRSPEDLAEEVARWSKSW